MQETRYDDPNKVYISVIGRFDVDGNIMPISFEWEDGRKYKVDRILDVCRAASLKAGGPGIRYTCMVLGKQTYLFREDDRWFVERKRV